MMIAESLPVVAVAAWAGCLAWQDLKFRRLPNWLTLSGAAVALVWRLGFGGWPLFNDGLAAAAVAGLFLFIPFLFHGAGAGDVKMFFAAGAMAGMKCLFVLLFVAFLVGLAMGLVMLVHDRFDRACLRHYGRCLLDWRYDRHAGRENLPPREAQRIRVPFGIAIALGAVAAMFVLSQMG